MPRFLLAAALLVAASTTSHAHAQVPGLRDPLSAAERSRLEQGEIVTREATETRGRLSLVGGTSWQVIDLPTDAVWRALRDVDRYHHMLPRGRTSRTVEREGNQRVVELTHGVGLVRAGFHLRMTFQRAQQIVLFQLDETRDADIEAGWGFLRVQPWGDGQTLLSYGVMVDPGRGLITGVLRPTFQEWILKIPLTMKWYVEGRGRSNYVEEEPATADASAGAPGEEAQGG